MRKFNWEKEAPKAAELVIQARTLYDQAHKMLTERAELLAQADNELKKILPDDPWKEAETWMLHKVITAIGWAKHPQPAGTRFSHHAAISTWVTDFVRLTATPHNPGVHNPKDFGHLRLNVYCREISSLRDPGGRQPHPSLISIRNGFEQFQTIVKEAIRLENDKECYYGGEWEHEGGFAVIIRGRVDWSICVQGDLNKTHAIIPEGWE